MNTFLPPTKALSTRSGNPGTPAKIVTQLFEETKYPYWTQLRPSCAPPKITRIKPGYEHLRLREGRGAGGGSGFGG